MGEWRCFVVDVAGRGVVGVVIGDRFDAFGTPISDFWRFLIFDASRFTSRDGDNYRPRRMLFPNQEEP